MRADRFVRGTAPPNVGVSRVWTGPAAAALQRRIDELVEGLQHGVLDAITRACATEIAQHIKTTQRPEVQIRGVRRFTPSREKAADRVPDGSAAWRDQRDQVDGGGAEAKSVHHGALDPFDITSPGELLASTQSTRGVGAAFAHPVNGASSRFLDPVPERAADTSPQRADNLGAAADPDSARKRSTGANPPTALESTVTLSSSEQEAQSERRPKIVLREGERLLSATGSGVVIRRERRVSPPR